MKIRLSKEERERGQRIIGRTRKMIKAALLLLGANLLADKTVFNIVKDQMAGRFSESLADSAYYESAFIDTYGDFEQMVEARRRADRTQGSRLPFASATTVYEVPDALSAELGLAGSDEKIRQLKL